MESAQLKLDRSEDRADLEAMREALAESDERIPYDQVRSQLDLDWARQHVRSGDPSTSIHAAESVREVAAKQAAAILAVLATIDKPLAVEQIADWLGTDSHRVGKRMIDLERDGVIERTKLIHRNRSGQPAFKWVAK